DYLRNLGARDWGASLDVALLPRRKKPKHAANDSEPEPEPEPEKRSERTAPPPKPKPKPKLRDARPSDAPRLVELIGQLGHEIDEKQVRRNLAALKKAGETPLVATLDKQVVGLCGMGRRVVIHRPALLGRI